MEQETSQLMRGLSSSVDSEATIESLKGLMAIIERADGATAEELAAALRRHGAVQRLCALVDDAAPSVHLLLEEQGSAHHEALHPLGLSFGEYVGLALAARGLAGFQKALSFATNQSPEAARFLQRLPELFPDADVRLFLPRVPRK